MKGIQFQVDEHGNPKAVILDLDEWEEIWEDFYFGIMATIALEEEGPKISWEELKAELDAELDREEIKQGVAAND